MFTLSPQLKENRKHEYMNTYHCQACQRFLAWGPYITRGPHTPSVLMPNGVLMSLRGMGTPVPKTLVNWGRGPPYQGGPYIPATPGNEETTKVRPILCTRGQTVVL